MSSEQLRNRATRCRNLASRLPHDTIRRKLLDAADEFDAEADELVNGESRPTPSPPEVDSWTLARRRWS